MPIIRTMPVGQLDSQAYGLTRAVTRENSGHGAPTVQNACTHAKTASMGAVGTGMEIKRRR